MTATWALQTARGAAGAIAIIRIGARDADELDAALRRIGGDSVGIGDALLRVLAGVDRGLVARWSPTSASLMPHAGPAVLRALLSRLVELGVPECKAAGPADYPEATGEIEARMLAALAGAASPLAIDLLLDQPRRWAGGSEALPREGSRVLRRLLDPPLVVALGPPNIGKSTLVNALAGRCIAIVSDQPGTTRDHVGVALDLAGLVVRYLDTPGLRPRPDPTEARAIELARAAARSADLILLCGDSNAPPPRRPAGADALRVALRNDLGVPAWRFDAGVSVFEDEGIERLVGLVRDRLVPPAVLADPRPWRFWP